MISASIPCSSAAAVGDVDVRAVGEHRQVAPLTVHTGDAELDRVVARGHLAERMLRPRHDRPVVMAVERPVVEPLRFEEDHRVLVLDRGDQQPLRVVRVRDDDGLEPGDVGEQRLRALAVRLAAVDAASRRHPHDEWHREVAGGAVAQAGRLRHDLVVGGIHVVGELDLDARPQAVGRHPDRRADDAGLVDRGVEAAVVAEPLLQPERAAEHPAEVADVLAEHDDAVVALHRHRVRVTDRLDHRHRRHQSPTCSRCSRRCRGISCEHVVEHRPRARDHARSSRSRGNRPPTKAASTWPSTSRCNWS